MYSSDHSVCRDIFDTFDTSKQYKRREAIDEFLDHPLMSMELIGSIQFHDRIETNNLSILNHSKAKQISFTSFGKDVKKNGGFGVVPTSIAELFLTSNNHGDARNCNIRVYHTRSVAPLWQSEIVTTTSKERFKISTYIVSKRQLRITFNLFLENNNECLEQTF